MFCCHWQSSCSSPQHLICEMSFITCIKHYFYYKNIYKTSDFIHCQTCLHHPFPLTPSCWQPSLFAPFLFHSLCSIPLPLLIPEKLFLPTANLLHMHTNISSLDTGFSFSVIPSTFTSLVSYIFSGLRLTPDVIHGGVTITCSLSFLKVRYILMMSDTNHILISNFNFEIYIR